MQNLFPLKSGLEIDFAAAVYLFEALVLGWSRNFVGSEFEMEFLNDILVEVSHSQVFV
jgi:hypothetical protein